MRVGFIGIGNMGWPMATHIAQAGHELTVFDADAERSTRFARENNCKAAANLGEVAANEITVTMLPTGKIVREALLENQGGAFAKALKPGALVIDMSSSEPVGTRELGVEIARRGARPDRRARFRRRAASEGGHARDHDRRRRQGRDRARQAAASRDGQATVRNRAAGHGPRDESAEQLHSGGGIYGGGRSRC